MPKPIRACSSTSCKCIRSNWKCRTKNFYAQATAEEASEKYSDLFDFAPVGYFVWDDDSRILEVNLAGAKLLGLDRHDVIRRRFGQFVAAESRPAFADFCKRVRTTDAKQTCEIRLLGDGHTVNVLVEGIAAQDRKGQRNLAARRSSTSPSKSGIRRSWPRRSLPPRSSTKRRMPSWSATRRGR